MCGYNRCHSTLLDNIYDYVFITFKFLVIRDGKFTDTFIIVMLALLSYRVLLVG
jgi:hypothetical protein